MVIDIPPGMQLVFPYTAAPHQQVLRIITLHLRNHARPGQPARLQGINIMYEGKQLTTIDSRHEGTRPLTRGKVIQLFGPTFSRRPSPQPNDRSSPAREHDIRYPGIIFTTDSNSQGEPVVSLALVPAGQEESTETRRFVEMVNGSPGKEPWPLVKWDERDASAGTVTLCEIIVRCPSNAPFPNVDPSRSHIKESPSTSPPAHPHQAQYTASTWAKRRRRISYATSARLRGGIGRRMIGSRGRAQRKGGGEVEAFSRAVSVSLLVCLVLY